MTDGQKVLLGMAIEPAIADEARQRMVEGGKNSAPGKGVPNGTPFPKQRTAADVADKVGTNQYTAGAMSSC